MRGLIHRWRQRTTSDDINPTGAEHLDLLDRLLRVRGVAASERDSFLKPSLLGLTAPEVIPGISRAADRIVNAIRKHESIVVYGDYDVDGISASVLLMQFVRALDPDARVRTYIPHRLDEGYGLNDDALRQLRAEGAELVITVDCGITAAAEAKVAREIGLDLIITDHHRVDHARLPVDCTLVHPGLDPEGQACTDLCGAGVAFKLAWAVATAWAGSERVGESLRHTLLGLLPLAALGTVADVVPMIGENRIITAIGLRLLSRTDNVGLRALIEATGLADRPLTTQHVAFNLAPHLNACGRLAHADEALTLLTTSDSNAAEKIARGLAETNRERQRTEREILQQAVESSEDRGMTHDDSRIIVLADERWHRGIVGIVCSRLVDRFHRPAVLMQQENGLCQGSARSIDGFSMIDALECCRDLLVSGGGHDMAAGLALKTEHLPELTERLAAYARERIDAESLTPTLHYDCEAQLDECSFETVRAIGQCEPFGRGNPRPSVLVRNVHVCDYPRQMGKNGSHLMLRLEERNDSRRCVMRTVWWRGGQHAEAIRRGSIVHTIIEPKINEWNGRSSVEAVIKDVHLCAPATGRHDE